MFGVLSYIVTEFYLSNSESTLAHTARNLSVYLRCFSLSKVTACSPTNSSGCSWKYCSTLWYLSQSMKWRPRRELSHNGVSLSITISLPLFMSSLSLLPTLLNASANSLFSPYKLFKQLLGRRFHVCKTSFLFFTELPEEIWKITECHIIQL